MQITDDESFKTCLLRLSMLYFYQVHHTRTEMPSMQCLINFNGSDNPFAKQFEDYLQSRTLFVKVWESLQRTTGNCFS